MKTITNIIYPVFALFAFACFGLSPTARAQCPSLCDNNGNTAVGDFALSHLTTGSDNTAIGNSAMEFTASGFSNTAIGVAALSTNQGFNNTATGDSALGSNGSGSNNTATGADALLNNNTSNNTAMGANALENNSNGTNNTAEGFSALLNSTGSNNIALGASAGASLTTGSNNIDIGALGSAGESNTIRLGRPGTQTRTFIAGIRGVTVPSGVGVIVGSNNQFGTVQSSKRFKEAIKPMDKASEAILALKPVTFRYKKELDPGKIPQFGLIAEEVEKVNPGLVARDEEGKIMSVRYEAVNAMLLNEFLKEHRKVESLVKAVAEQQKENAGMRAMLKQQAAQIQKVSAQLELSKSAPQTVVNNR